LRICHLISGDLWAGAEVMVYHLLRGLQVYDRVVLSAVVLNEGRLADEIRHLGVNVQVIDERNNSFLSILSSIRKLFLKQPPHIIHSHRYKENILAYLISRSIGNTSLIGTQHGLLELQGKNHSLKRRILYGCNFFVLARCFDSVISVSHDIQKTFVDDYSCNPEKVKIIHNGIDIPELQPKKNSGGVFVIGSSGRLFPVKDYPFMIEVAKLVSERTNHIRFELAGDGPELRNLQALIMDYNLGNRFVLRGHLDHMSSFYHGLDLYLSTSTHEGIPMSILEGMVHGLPVVAPKVGGISEIVDDGIQGYLAEKRDPREFAEKCLLLHDNKLLRQEMSRAARKKVIGSFSVGQMAEQYYNLYLNHAGNG